MIDFLKIALVISEASYSQRKKVGAVIVSEGRIISTGYNGMPSGFPNDCEYFPEGSMVTKPEVIHAEANAILFAARFGIKTEGCKMYMTMSPCIECAKMIIQAGIKEIEFIEEYRDTSSFDLLKRAGVKIVLNSFKNKNT
jgi:dCMP deaminase